MKPIDAKVKEAWEISQDYPDSIWIILANAYVHERAMREKAEHERDCDDYVYPKCRPECPLADADWEARVRKELEGGK